MIELLGRGVAPCWIVVSFQDDSGARGRPERQAPGRRTGHANSSLATRHYPLATTHYSPASRHRYMILGTPHDVAGASLPVSGSGATTKKRWARS